MSQASYNQYMPKAALGLLVDIRTCDFESYAAEGPVVVGGAVVAGTDAEHQVETPSATGGTLRGIAVLTHAVEQTLAGEVAFANTATVPVLRRGAVWVKVRDAVVADEAATFLFDGTGEFSNTGGNAVPTGVFRSTAEAGGLAKLEINLP